MAPMRFSGIPLLETLLLWNILQQLSVPGTAQKEPNLHAKLRKTKQLQLNLNMSYIMHNSVFPTRPA